MRTITKALIAIAAITIMVSWGKPLSTRMNEFVDNVGGTGFMFATFVLYWKRGKK